MQIAGHDIGVCSWSLGPADMAQLVQVVRELGLQHVHLALEPLLFLDDKRKHHELGILRDSGITLTAGMISFPGEDYSTIDRIRITAGLVPDASWLLRRQLIREAARVAHDLGINLLTTHGGFLPPSNHADYGKLLLRFDEVSRMLADSSVTLTLETGQEPASDLLQFLNDLPTDNIAVNYDPANMILYGAGDPIESVQILSRHIRHMHIKDAEPSSEPGIVWGTETPICDGKVDFAKLFIAIKEVDYRGPLVIERAFSGQPIADIHKAIESLREIPT